MLRLVSIMVLMLQMASGLKLSAPVSRRAAMRNGLAAAALAVAPSASFAASNVGN
tara:strand:- start:1685 stop:1849 length:165 start_codon:yes stop_codon:yes gene_type:complete